ncbi:hypothetical protein ACNI3Q_14015 [Sphingomonas sp. FW199]|uniref:hypothetical protein n=1 Tax=Sphingomonas sp. FW199 TaxID=3400217 RepID=UPI003CF90254
MFGTVKPAASLSSGLLARKGQAKPAMRPQGYVGGYPAAEAPIEDLGWNDMGEGVQPRAVTAAVPEVVRQREALAAELAQPVPVDIVAEAPAEPSAPAEAAPLRPVSVKTAERLRRETRHKGRKAAFTLRLDEERHLKLRLASALHRASAQQLVTEALDQFLNAIPEVETLVAQLPAGKGR